VTAVWWAITVSVGLLLALALVATWSYARRRFAPARTIVRGGARRLGGRIDPASERSATPALLVEMDGRLLRAVGWPEVPDDEHPRLAPFLEVCTPIDGSTAPVVAVRRSVLASLARHLGEDGRRLAASPAPGAVAVVGAAAGWAGRIVDEHEAWALLELDAGSLRVLTTHPQSNGYDAVALEAAVREFSAAVPAILLAAGITDSSARSDGR
jgi:hypothetical protein